MSEQAINKICEGGRLRREGVAELYQAYARKFLGYFMRNRMLREVADELVQDTFVKIVASCDEYRGDGPLEAWLWRIARNTLISHVRRDTPEDHGLSLNDEELEPALSAHPALHVSSAVGDGLEPCVDRAFAEFAAHHPARAESLRLATVEGWNTEEIAQYLGRTSGAAREYLSQCRKLVRPFLERCREFLAAA